MKVRLHIEDTIKSLKKAVKKKNLTEVSTILENLAFLEFTQLGEYDRKILIVDIINLTGPLIQTNPLADEIIQRLATKTSETEVRIACLAFQISKAAAQADEDDYMTRYFGPQNNSCDTRSMSHETQSSSQAKKSAGEHSSTKGVKKRTIEAESENINSKESKNAQINTDQDL